MKTLSLKLWLVVLSAALSAETMASTISGSISYAGASTGQIYVAAFTDTTFRGNSSGTVQINSPGSYTITGLSDGVYYVGSIMMTDSTKGVQMTDPWGGYETSGSLAPITIAGGGNVSSINFVLVDGTVTDPNPFYRKPVTPKLVIALPNAVGNGTSPSLAYDGTSMYLHKQDYSGAASGKMYKINPYSGAVTATSTTSLTSSANGTSWIGGMTFLKGNLWISGGYGDPAGTDIWKVGVFRMDISTSRSSNQLPTNSGIDAIAELGGLATDGTNLYVGVTLTNLQKDKGVVKFDPSSVSEVPAAPFFKLDYQPEYLCYGDACLWAGTDSVRKINPLNGTTLSTYNLPRSCAEVYLDDMFWMYDQSDNTLKAYSLEATGVARGLETPVPSNYQLSQNYPNPFNPSTTISYAIPTRSIVTLSVFNTLGQKVAELVNGEKKAGNYDVTFSASGLASGVYLYRLQAGNFVQTKKLVVMK